MEFLGVDQIAKMPVVIVVNPWGKSSTRVRNHQIYWERIRGGKENTYDRIGRRYGITRTRVRQIVEKVKQRRRRYYDTIGVIDILDPYDWEWNDKYHWDGRIYNRALAHALAIAADSLGCGPAIKGQ